jgi:hypothetical protein
MKEQILSNEKTLEFLRKYSSCLQKAKTALQDTDDK